MLVYGQTASETLSEKLDGRKLDGTESNAHPAEGVKGRRCQHHKIVISDVAAASVVLLPVTPPDFTSGHIQHVC